MLTVPLAAETATTAYHEVFWETLAGVAIVVLIAQVVIVVVGGRGYAGLWRDVWGGWNGDDPKYANRPPPPPQRERWLSGGFILAGVWTYIIQLAVLWEAMDALARKKDHGPMFGVMWVQTGLLIVAPLLAGWSNLIQRRLDSKIEVAAEAREAEDQQPARKPGPKTRRRR